MCTEVATADLHAHRQRLEWREAHLMSRGWQGEPKALHVHSGHAREKSSRQLNLCDGGARQMLAGSAQT